MPIDASLLDGIPEALAPITPPMWGDFPPQHPMIIHAVALAFFLLWVLNALGNGMVVFIFMVSRELRTPVCRSARSIYFNFSYQLNWQWAGFLDTNSRCNIYVQGLQGPSKVLV